MEIDFKKLYPGKENFLFDNWEKFCETILPLMEVRIKDLSSLEILKQYKSEKFSLGIAYSFLFNFFLNIFFFQV